MLHGSYFLMNSWRRMTSLTLLVWRFGSSTVDKVVDSQVSCIVAPSLCVCRYGREQIADCRVQGIYRDAIGQNPIDNVAMMLLLGGVQSPYFWSTNFVESWNGAPSAESFIPTGITFGLATSWWILLQIVFLNVTSGRDAKRTILYALDSSLESGAWWAIDVGNFVWSRGGHTMSKSAKTWSMRSRWKVPPSYATSWSILVKLNCTLRDFSVEIREVLRFFLALAYEIQLDVVSSLHVKAVHDSEEK